MDSPRINVNIERIILDGNDFASFHPHDIQAAVAAQLKSQLLNLQINLNNGYQTHRIAGVGISEQSTTSSDTLATSVANSISSAISTGGRNRLI